MKLLLLAASLAPGPLFGDGNGFVTLDNGHGLRATISPDHGGELAGLEIEIDGAWRELVYRARDYSPTEGWRGKAPFLWPAVGISLEPGEQRRGFRVHERFYPMPSHGFARDRAWRLVEQGRDEVGPFAILALSSDPGTRPHYPFDFELNVEYRLDESRLLILYSVKASGENDGPMPFSIGNHITFRAPLLGVGEAAALRFRTDLPLELIRGEDRTFSGRTTPSPYRGEHPLSSLPRRRAVSLGGAEGQAELTLFDPSGLVLALRHSASAEPSRPAIRFNLWADTEEGFFSPEPWIGTQNALNSGAGLVQLEPGEEWRWRIEIEPSQAGLPAAVTQEQSP